ncbi:unnamed protein product [Mesocestoides corti]|uniref:Synaptotagmin-11 n=1 Tax=Mesocestoides corti TaxID=53468 RepID=A0A158QV96_MESCO|nr:unnamed protein product [Mesocestoides corti]
MGNPGAIAGFIVGFTLLILTVAGATYTLIYKRRRTVCTSRNLSSQDIPRKLNLGKDLLLDEPHSFTRSQSVSSVIGETSSRHLASPEKPLNDRNSHSQAVSAVSGLGKIQFAVAYDSVMQELQISVLRCVELPQLDSSLGTVDSYVKMELLPEKIHRVKTRVVRSNRNPFFGEAFTMNRVSLDQLSAASLHFIVVGFDRHSRDSVIGEVVCPLNDLKLSLCKEVTLTKEIMRRKFNQPAGGNRGSLLISLCYLPAACRLTAVVLKAEGLPTVDLADSPGNPYVKLYFVENDRRIAKKKTHVKKRTSNPVFNEAFALEIPLHVKLENIKLDFRMVNWERDSPSKVVGHVIIGYGGNKQAREHWKTAIENPRKQVAEWHNILA